MLLAEVIKALTALEKSLPDGGLSEVEVNFSLGENSVITEEWRVPLTNITVDIGAAHRVVLVSHYNLEDDDA